jgi:rhamnulokinase
VAAIPADGSDWAFILSDSVSHIGIETTLPVLTIPAMEGNFTNEGGVEGTNLCMKKLSGLGLLEECRKQWYENSSVSAEMVSAMYIDAPAFVTFIDPDHYSFFNPPSMPDAIRGFCMNSGQDIPQTHAQIVRTILESLAMKYRIAIDQLRKVASREIHRIHITGTGCENEVFCQFIANACSVQVIAGPGETTTIGNILCQARTAGYLNSLEDIRSVVVHSFKTREYQPVKSNEWDKAHTRFLSFIR